MALYVLDSRDIAVLALHADIMEGINVQQESPHPERYHVIWVSPERLDPSPHQPEGRTKFDSSMGHLQRNIQSIGLQYPPLVMPKADGRFTLIDGHRRVVCMKLLGHVMIPVLPTEGKTDELYAGVSGNVAKMKASQWVEVFLSGGMVPSGPNKTCITRLSEVMGRHYLEALVKKGWSPQIWNVSKRILKYAELSEEKQKPVLNWLLNIGTREVTAWMQSDNSPEALRTALAEDRLPQ